MISSAQKLAVRRTRIRRTAIIFIAISPLAIIPGAENRFVFGKLLVVAIGAGLALIVPGKGQLPRWVWLPLGVATAVVALSALLAASPASAWWGRGEVYQGAPFLALCILVAVAGARHLGPGAPVEERQLVITAMAVVAILVGALALLEAFGLRPLSSDASRPGSFLGNASDEGLFGVLYGGILLIAAMAERKPIVIAGAAAAGATVVMSASRGAWIGMAAAIVVAAILAGGRARLIALGAAALAAVEILVDPATRQRLLGGSDLAGQTVSGRLLLWQESIRLWLHHPVLGVGPSQFENAIVSERDFRWQHQIGPQNPPATPHDLVLQLLLVGGPILLGAVGFLLWRLYRAARVEPDWGTGVIVAFSGYLVALLFTFPTPSTVLPALALAGSAIAVKASTTTAPRRQFVEWAAVAVAGVLALGFLFASYSEIKIRQADQALADHAYAQAQSDFTTAYDLRWWDADLASQVLHDFVNAGAGGAQYAWVWDSRVGDVADDIQVIQARAGLRLNAGQPEAAARLLEEALKRDRYNPQLLIMRGVAFGMTGKFQAARADFERATQVAPSNKAAWADLARVYGALGMSELAQRANQTASQLYASP
jgi:tetratricopeptide (TPR) repeat protein